MPGRPRTMLKKVAALVAQAEALQDAIEETMPEQYRIPGRVRGDIAEMWTKASDAAFALAFTLSEDLEPVLIGHVHNANELRRKLQPYSGAETGAVDRTAV